MMDPGLHSMHFPGAVFTDLMRRVELDRHRRGWHGDNPVQPWVYLMRGQMRRTHALISTHQLDIPDKYWALFRGGPVPALKRWAHALDHQSLDGLAPVDDFLGLLFVYEAWSLRVHKDDVAAVAAADAMLATRTVHRSPDRYEVRGIMATTADGRQFHMLREKGCALRVDGAPQGGIPDALSRLCQSMAAAMETASAGRG